MVFPSYEFAFFFPVVLALSWALMPHPRAWKPFILASSYVFYAAASPRYALLLAGVTLANQAGALLVARTEVEKGRRLIMAATVAVDLGVLGLFKYYGFFAGEISSFLDSLGLGMPLPLLTLALPIGLSFITFQAISYVVDVKRGLLSPASRRRPDRARCGRQGSPGPRLRAYGSASRSAAPGAVSKRGARPAPPPNTTRFTSSRSRALFVGGGARGVLSAGDIIVVPAGVPHRFQCCGRGLLRDPGIHVSPRFVTDWLLAR